MVAGALDDGDRPRIAHREAVAHAARGEQRAAGRPVQGHVAEDHVAVRLRGIGGLPERPDHDLPAGESLADVVVRLALELEVHRRKGEGAEALTRAAAEAETH